MNSKQDIFAKCYTSEGYFGKLRAMGDNFLTRPTLPIKPATHMDFAGKKCIMWSINDYLGLANHPDIKEVASDSLDKYGISSPMGSRMMSGTTQSHLDLEDKLAKWVGKEAAYLFNYGYMGVLGVVSSLAGPQDTIVLDKLAHASIIDAAFLSTASTRIFKHNNAKDLESILKKIREKSPQGGILILIEGVYGMTGDLAPLREIIEVKKKYNARLFIDDAHGCGVLGEKGRGIGDYYGVMQDVDIYFGTFAKAFAAIGGFAASDKAVIEWIAYNSRTQVFAKSLPIIYVHALNKTLDMVIDGEERRKILWERSNKLKKGLHDAGFYIGTGESPIVSTFISIKGEQPFESVAPETVRYLRKEGVFVTGITYPVIPHGLVMYRMIPTAAHTEEDISETIRVFKKMKEELQLDTNMTEKEIELLNRVYLK